MKQKVRKLKQEEYNFLNLFLLFGIILSILSIGIIGISVIFFKDNPSFIIIMNILVWFYTHHKLNKFRRMFYE